MSRRFKQAMAFGAITIVPGGFLLGNYLRMREDNSALRQAKTDYASMQIKERAVEIANVRIQALLERDAQLYDEFQEKDKRLKKYYESLKEKADAQKTP